jgi:hypothetical protein
VTTPKPEAPSLFALLVMPIAASILTVTAFIHTYENHAVKAVLFTVLALAYWFMVAFMAQRELRYRKAKED